LRLSTEPQFVDPLRLNQEVGGSTSPSCTNKINSLGESGRACPKFRPKSDLQHHKACELSSGIFFDRQLKSNCSVGPGLSIAGGRPAIGSAAARFGKASVAVDVLLAGVGPGQSV